MYILSYYVFHNDEWSYEEEEIEKLPSADEKLRVILRKGAFLDAVTIKKVEEKE